MSGSLSPIREKYVQILLSAVISSSDADSFMMKYRRIPEQEVRAPYVGLSSYLVVQLGVRCYK